MSNNCQYITLEEWVIELAYDDRLDGDDRKVAVFAVTLQDASNAFLMQVCKIGKDKLNKIKKKLSDLNIISIAGCKRGGRGNSRRIQGCLPNGFVVLMESEYEKESGSTQNHFSDEKRYQTGSVQNHFKENNDKKSGSESGLKAVSNRFCTEPLSPPNNIYNNPLVNSNEFTPPTPQGGSTNFSGHENGRQFWSQALGMNPNQPENIRMQNGQIELSKETKDFWLGQFGGDLGRLELELIGLVGRIRPNSGRPLEVQVNTILAQKAAEKLDKDQRYKNAVKQNQQTKQGVASNDEALRQMRIIAGEAV